MKPGVGLDLDVLVVGGGPAGSACAIRLAQAGGLRVAIVEASDFSQFRVGETLEPAVRPLLLELGVEVDGQEWSAPCAGVSAAWGGAAAQRPSIFHPHGRGWRVDRRRLDRALFEQARQAGAAAFMRARFATAARRAGTWTFELRAGNDALAGRARWIVAATGRNARTPLAPDRSRVWIDRLVGIALRAARTEPCDVCTPAAAVVEAASHGWWYHVRVPDGQRVAIFFTDADLLPKENQRRAEFLLDELAQAPLTGAACEFVPAMIRQHRWTGFDARSGIQRLAMSDGWIAAGDAMMAFDPLCGRGVSEAIRSGNEVASWLLDSGFGESEETIPPWIHGAADRFNAYRSQRLATYRHETRWRTSEFWQRRWQ